MDDQGKFAPCENFPPYGNVINFFPGTYAEEIFQAYSQEMTLRENIVKDILQQTERDTLTVYLSCWLHQPYVSRDINDRLEAMLIECSLRL